MPTCDRCDRPAALVAYTEAATLDMHGNLQSGRLCPNCWQGDWPFDQEVDDAEA